MDIAQPASLQLGRAVDSLVACGSLDGKDILACGSSNFWGPTWTGTLSILAADEGGATLLATSADLPCGVPAVAVLPQRDPYTGG